MTLSVSQLFIYPVKSCRGIDLKKLEIEKHGFELDRLWVVVTEDYKFITARTHPKLMTIVQSLQADPSEENKILVKLVSKGNLTPLFLDPSLKSNRPEVQVSFWKEHVAGYDCGDEASEWFSSALGEKVRLVIKGPRARRVDDLYLNRDGLGHIIPEATFTDEFSIFMVSEESMKALQEELPQEVKDTVSVKNFRPNIVIRGCSSPFEEDSFGTFLIGQNKFHCDAPCARCVLPNVNPETGIPHETEPSKTLMRIRRSYPHIAKYKSFFGINVLSLESHGSIEVGQNVEIISRTEK